MGYRAEQLRLVSLAPAQRPSPRHPGVKYDIPITLGAPPPSAQHFVRFYLASDEALVRQVHAAVNMMREHGISSLALADPTVRPKLLERFKNMRDLDVATIESAVVAYHMAARTKDIARHKIILGCANRLTLRDALASIAAPTNLSPEQIIYQFGEAVDAVNTAIWAQVPGETRSRYPAAWRSSALG